MDFNSNNDNNILNNGTPETGESTPVEKVNVEAQVDNTSAVEKVNVSDNAAERPAVNTVAEAPVNSQQSNTLNEQRAADAWQAFGAYSGQQRSYTDYSAPRYSQPSCSSQPQQSASQPQQNASQPQRGYQQMPGQVQPVDPKQPKKGGAGKVFGRICLALLTGAIFGACACFAWMGATKLMPNESVVSEVESFNKDAYKAEIEKEIIAKIEANQNKADNSIVKSVTTESDAVMQVTDVSDVVEDVMPSVVSIMNTFTYTMNYWGRQISEQSEASGSGIIIGENDTELLIATNNHVIEGAEVLTVLFIDGEKVEAKVKGADSDNDVAVIAVKLDDLKKSTRGAIEIATLGDSDALKVGEPAIAIGNALGYGQSVTTGVISALDRKLELEDGKMSEGFIQTDAAINPGNSGGALLNVRGEVVGINSNKIGGSSVEGMGYAIPISRALPIIDNLKTKKTKNVAAEERGYLGISGRAVSAEMVEVYDFPEGIYVYDVFAGTGAEAAGLRKGDIITKFEGTTVKTMEALQENLSYYEAGETIELTISRVNDSGTYDEINMQVNLISSDAMPAE